MLFLERNDREPVLNWEADLRAGTWALMISKLECGTLTLSTLKVQLVEFKLVYPWTYNIIFIEDLLKLVYNHLSSYQIKFIWCGSRSPFQGGPVPVSAPGPLGTSGAGSWQGLQDRRVSQFPINVLRLPPHAPLMHLFCQCASDLASLNGATQNP